MMIKEVGRRRFIEEQWRTNRLASQSVHFISCDGEQRERKENPRILL